MIGGYQQTGNYKIDARYRKENLISRIRRIATYADRIELHNEDAVDLVADIAQTAPPDTLLYLRATYKLTNHQGEKQEVTQTFYLDKGLTRVIGFKEN